MNIRSFPLFARFAQSLTGVCAFACLSVMACDSGSNNDDKSENDDDDDDDNSTSSTSSTTPTEQDSTPDDDTGTSTPLAFTPCPDNSRVGGFAVTLEETYTGILGRVRDGLLPFEHPIVLQESGACKLLHARVNTCTPACAALEICTDQMQCIAYPDPHTLGVATIDGMKIAVSMTPNDSFVYSNPNDLPHPGYDDGARLDLKTEGGDYAPVDLSVRAAAKMVAPSAAIAIEREKGASVTWTPAAADESVRVEIELTVNRHGTSAATFVQCLVEDTGSFEIPSDLVTKIIDEGVTGYPWIILTRKSIDSMMIEPGCVDLVSSASQTLDVTVPGIVSCMEDEECPEGQTCGGDRICHAML